MRHQLLSSNSKNSAIAEDLKRVTLQCWQQNAYACEEVLSPSPAWTSVGAAEW
jgi:hypothetical protein